MIGISEEQGLLVVRADPGDLAPRHESQLNFWGFSSAAAGGDFSCQFDTGADIVPRLVAYLERSGLRHELDPKVAQLLAAQKQVAGRLVDVISRGKRFKSAEMSGLDLQHFARFTKCKLARPLKEHQLKAALHLLCVENGANFSVPGSGKTSVVLAVFQWLRHLNLVDALFVVGPPSCFGPWRYEYGEVIGKTPAFEIIAGGDVELRRSKYHTNAASVADLYLTTFQTLQRDWELVRVLFEQQSLRFFLVVDEAHYIKQMDGAWAGAVLRIAKHAARRCVLTGTPFPRSYADGFNLFDVLWPDAPAISSEDRHNVVVLCQKRRWHHAAQILEQSIGPLFYRVRKDDLGLAPQIFHPPVLVKMKRYERLVYDLILDKVQRLSLSDAMRNQDLLTRLRRGRMMRLRQCLSYAPLLTTSVADYTEDLTGDQLSIADIIKRYDTLERPAKIEALLQLVQQLVANGQKVVVWSNFVRTLEHVTDLVNACGIGAKLIFGGTPVERSNIEEESTREEIIAEFVDRNSDTLVLVANPAACAESISLHKACANAIYYDLSYNCAQYVQSLDRIHRVGGSETNPSHYYFLQCADTIDGEILANVRRKADNMNRVIDKDYPVYSLDMFEEDDELEAYERLFGASRQRV